MDFTAMLEVKEFLHMKHGDGESSYAQNTVIQRAAAYRTKPIVEKAVHYLLSHKIIRPGDHVLRVADLGCGFGPIPLAFISAMIENVHNKCKALKWNDDQVPELHIYLNDLPSNDFNTLFNDVAKLQLEERRQHGKVPFCFAMAAPGSFHARVLARNSLHFVHSNYALHWLSQVPSGLNTKQGCPLNRRNIHVTESSPPIVAKAYLTQFQKDWTSFLNSRAEEVVSGGRLVLVVRGRPSLHLQPIWELHLLGQAIASLVFQEVIKEEKLDTFNVPIYYPSKEEIEGVVQKEGSFEIEHMETVVDHILREMEDNHEKAETLSKCVRSFSESVVSHHFGENVLDRLYSELTQLTYNYVVKEPTPISSIILLLTRKCSGNSSNFY